MKKIALFGATGSIGTSTLDVVSHYPSEYEIFALTANSRVEMLAELCLKHRPKIALITDASKRDALCQALSSRGLNDIDVWAGEAKMAQLAALPEVDIAVLAIVGAAGLTPTFAAAKAGKRLLLANKESVVCGGALLMQTIKQSGAELLPVDSEHNAIFQCLSGANAKDRAGARLILTASGGPFRHRMDLTDVTPQEACAHPNWSMGRKISVDSATLMNKGLEVIEASWLFGFGPDQIDVVVHPQSLIHSMVQYADGCILAQMGSPDMRTPIAYSLGWPNRLDGHAEKVDFTKYAQCTFELPDLDRFPQLGYAYDALRSQDAATIILNAANEVAVEAFLNERIKFLDIARACKVMLNSMSRPLPRSLEEVLEVDKEARILTHKELARWTR